MLAVHGQAEMGILVWLVLAVILLCSGVQSRPPPPACPSPCLCTPGPTLNCSTAGLSLAPPLLPASLSSLDLSHNLLTSFRQRWAQPSLRRLWLGHNNLTHLSLCVGGPRPPHHGPPGGMEGCESWAPALEMLSAERNLLEGLPRGLKGLRALQVLHLPNNRISSVGEEDLGHLPHLRELLLQNNLISILHPQALRHLPQLRVLDLSFNLLTTLSPTTHLWLGALGGGASLRGNSWRCDCALRSVRRWMTHDRDLGQRNWGGVVCAWPPSLSGRELLQLEEAELSCSRGGASEGRHQEVMVEEGTKLLLPCDSQQGSQWQTPRGVASGGVSGLLIHDITAQDSGLYVCVSGPERALSVYDVHVHLTREPGPRARTRSSRSLNRAGQTLSPLSGSRPQGAAEGGKSLETPTKSDLTLAICLSVLITFLVAFILGVLARPLLEKLCRRLRPKQSPSSSTNGPALDAHCPYENGAYSDEEEEQEGGHSKRRVSFSRPAGVQRDPGTVEYYDTLAGSEPNDQVYATIETEAVYANTLQWEPSPGTPEGGRPRGRNNSERESASADREQPLRGHTMEFETIPDLDPGEERGRLSESSSHSSHSSHSSDVPGRRGQVTQNNPWEPLSPPQTDLPLQQRVASPVVTQASTLPSPGAGSEVPGFSSEPFADWKPKMAVGEDPEEYNDSGESFEFSDSFRGASGRYSDLGFPTGSVRKHSDSSVCSESETTEYTVNVEREEVEEKDEAVKDAQLAHGTLLPPDLHPRAGADQERFRDKQVESSGSSQSSNSDGEDTQYTVNREEDEEEEVNPVPHPENRDSSFSVGGVPLSFTPRRALNIHLDKSSQLSTDQSAWRSTSTKYQEQEIKPSSPPETPRTPQPAFSSSDSEDETREQTKVPENRDSSFSVAGVPVSFTPRRALNIHLDKSSQLCTDQSAWRSTSTKYQDHQIRAASQLSFDKTVPSSSSDSEDETREKTKDPENRDSSFSVGGVPVSFTPRRALNIHLDNSSQLNADQNAWRSTSTKYQEQEIKPSSPPETPRTPQPASSSSDSEDETREQTKVPENHDSSFSVGGVPVSFAPRRALNIHLDKSSQLCTDQSAWRSTSTKYQDHQIRAASQLSFDKTVPSSSSDSEDETREKTKDSENRDSSFSVGGVPVSFTPRRALNIHLDNSSQLNADQNAWRSTSTKYQEQEIKPSSPPETPRTPQPASSSSDSEDETREQTKVPENRDSSFSVGGVPVSFAPRRALNIHLDKSSQLCTDQSAWRSTSTKYQDHQIRAASQLSFDKTVPSSSSNSEDETREKTKDPENRDSSFSVGGVPVSFTPRRALNIHLDNSSQLNADQNAWRSTSTKYQEQEIKPSSPPETPRTPQPASSSSDSEDETREQTKVPENRDSSFSVGGVPVSFAPRRALNIHLDKSSQLCTDQSAWRSTSTKYQDHQIRAASQLSFDKTVPSSSSDSEDETREKTKDPENLDSSFSVGGVPVSFTPRRALNIHLDNSSQLNADQNAWRSTSTKYQEQEIKPTSPPETPRTPQPASSSSDSEDETREQTKVPENRDSSFSVGGVPVSFAPRRALNIHLDKSSQLSTAENAWRSTSTKYQEPEIKPAPPPEIPRTPPPASSSSDSEDETREQTTGRDSPFSVGSVKVSFGPRRALNVHLDNSAQLSTDQNAWRSNSTKYQVEDRSFSQTWGQLDTKPPQESPPASSSDSKEETSEHINKQTKVPVNRDSSFSVGGVPVSLAPRRALNIHLDNSSSNTDEYAWRSTSTKYQEQEIKSASPPEIPRTPPPASSSSDSEDKTREQTKVPENHDSSFSVGGVPVSFAPRRALNIHLDNSSQLNADQNAWRSTSTKYQEQEIKPSSPPETPRTPQPASSSSDSEDETSEQINRQTKYDKDSPFSVGGVKMSLAPRRAINIHLDSSTQLSTEEKACRPTSTKYQGEDRSSSQTWRRLDIQVPQETPPEIPRTPPPASSSSDSEDETREQTKVSDNHDSSFSVGGVPVSFTPRRALNIHLDNSSHLTDENTWRPTSTKYREEDIKHASRLSSYNNSTSSFSSAYHSTRPYHSVTLDTVTPTSPGGDQQQTDV
ncbi:microtubule-associated protein futsch [Osmerus mordax]|uniref:microtubule-associated protein futsch n=1 Tax=Osmerus mordax TaxID=8014 RepID=UPI00350EB358